MLGMIVKPYNFILLTPRNKEWNGQLNVAIIQN